MHRLRARLPLKGHSRPYYGPQTRFQSLSRGCVVRVPSASYRGYSQSVGLGDKDQGEGEKENTSASKISVKQVFGQNEKELARQLSQQVHGEGDSASPGGVTKSSSVREKEEAELHGGPKVATESISDDEEKYDKPPLGDISAQSLDRAREAAETGTIGTQYDPSVDKLMRSLEREYDHSQSTRTVHADGPEFPPQDPYAHDRRWSYLSMTRELRDETYVPKNPYMSNVIYDTNYIHEDPTVINVSLCTCHHLKNKLFMILIVIYSIHLSKEANIFRWLRRENSSRAFLKDSLGNCKMNSN